MNAFSPDILRFYFIAGTQDCRHGNDDPAQRLLSVLQQALQQGISCFQFRDKESGSLEGNPQAQSELARQCLALCRAHGVPFIMNDNVAMALEIGADGIHVGQGDMPVPQLAAQLPRRMIIGLSCNTLAEAQHSNPIAEIDYFGVGPVFPTQSKEKPKPVIGTDFVRTLRQAGISKPIVSIGGITPESAGYLRQAGADGVAFISALTRSADIAATMQAFRQACSLGKPAA